MLESDGSKQNDPLARACELVGRFLYSFSRLEAKLDAAIAKLLKLDNVSASIVAANLDFVRKLNIVQTAVQEQNASPGEKWLTNEIEQVFKRIRTINDSRQIMAHSPFGPSPGGGVVFDRTVAKGKLSVKQLDWDEAMFEKTLRRMENLERGLDSVLRHIRPYEPSLDFSDPLNSGYLAL
jgi:hypothetical protein